MKRAKVEPTTVPAFVAPELATLVSHPPSGPLWVHEIKFDGYRLLCRRDGDRVQIFTRNGNDWTSRFLSLVAAVRALKARRVVVDGEAVVLDAKGVSSFARMQDAMARKDDSAIVFFAFDLMHLDGKDTSAMPLVERKAILQRILGPKLGKIRYSEHLEGNGATVLKQACAMGLEGIVSKRVDKPYSSGRGGDWLKSKCLQRQEFVVVGYSERTNARNEFGSLVLAAHEGGRLVYTGNVGTGWSDRIRKAILERLFKLRVIKPTVTLPHGVSAQGIHWVKPKLVVEVAFAEWTNDGLVRHPSFKGLREDKGAKDVAIERPASVPHLKGGGDWTRRRKTRR